MSDINEPAPLVHAWFSAGTALRSGSTVYRKSGGSTVNVTRLTADRLGKGATDVDERYVGEVIAAEQGGCVRGLQRVNSITP